MMMMTDNLDRPVGREQLLRGVKEPGRANCLFWNGPQKTKIGGEATGKLLPP